MTGTICYIERAERGCLPLRLRILSLRREDSWTFPEIEADDAMSLERGLGEAADWISGWVRENGGGGLEALVLDADGAFCSWIASPNADPEAIAAMLRHSSDSGLEDDPAHAVGSPPHLAIDPDVQNPGAASVQPLGVREEPRQGGSLLARKKPDESGQPRQRMGVMAIADSTVRLLIDELDARGVDVAHATTVWHAAALAFERRGSGSRGERVIAESSDATSAVVFLEPRSKRLLWSWSRDGSLVASGSFRVARGHGSGEDDQPQVSLGRADMARLASEWIAWSTQLGASPCRVRVVLSEAAWQDEASLGEVVASVWPGATADITFDDDPVGLVLAGFCETCSLMPDRPGGDVAALQHRPGREHRGMYRWGAIAIGAAAIAMGVIAFKVGQWADSAQRQAQEKREEWRQIASELKPSLAQGQQSWASFDGLAILELQQELQRLKQEIAPVSSGTDRPILQELETLAFVLGSPDYRLERLEIRPLGVYIDVVVPDTAAYEALSESLNRIAGSSVASWTRSVRNNPRGTDDGLRCSFEGVWSDGGPRSASRGQS